VIKHLIILVLLFVWSCEEVTIEQDNPLDPNNPIYNAPNVDFTSGTLEGDTVYVSDITFTWEGNELIAEYRTKLDDNDWLEWNNGSSIELEHLDEGDHRISLQGRYSTGDTSSIITTNFVVDAVMGPALMFFPRRQIAVAGENVSFQILAEEVSNLSAAEFQLQFDPSDVQINDISPGSAFASLGEMIFIKEIDNVNGFITISTAVFGESYPVFTGTGDIALIDVQIITSGEHAIQFDGSEVFRDHENSNIIINDLINGLITVE
tara:strand:+ start:753 stop:1544 length:792 start_codon:yes stop_codon:yes gene_type:complete